MDKLAPPTEQQAGCFPWATTV